MGKLKGMSARGLRAYKFVVQRAKASKKLSRKDKRLVLKANKIIASEIHRFVIDDLKGIRAESVLEIGCGDGGLLRTLSKQKGFANSRLFGIDNSPEEIVKARRMSKAAKSVHYSDGRNDRIPHAGKFDLIFTVLSFHEWKKGNESIPYILSRLNKNGSFLIYDTPPVKIKNPKPRRKAGIRFKLQKNSALIKATFVAPSAPSSLVFDNRTFVRYSRKWSKSNNPYLVKLKKKYKLGRLASVDNDQYKTLKNCVRWVHSRWEHSGVNVPKKSDTISILDEARKGKRFRCVEYSIVLNACLTALGIKSRTINIMKKSIEMKKPCAGHVIVEAYLNDYGKWVMADGQSGSIPMLKGIPLNAVEYQKAIVNKEPLKIWGHENKAGKAYTKWIFPYLFYFRIWLDPKVLTLVPLGAKNPRKFEGVPYPPRNVAVYTNSLRTFYAKPPSPQAWAGG